MKVMSIRPDAQAGALHLSRSFIDGPNVYDISGSPCWPNAAVGMTGTQVAVRVSAGFHHHIVHVTGELDLASRDHLGRACIGSHHRFVIVDLAALTFMDCAGYGALVTARLTLEALRGLLTLVNAVGQPARLLELIASLEGR